MKVFILILLFSQILFAQGIEVVGKKEPIEPKRLKQEEISRIPGGFGEPLRAIETLPGVGITSFLLGEFSIRGANPNANNVYIDNLPIGYLFHTLGIHSTINKSFISHLNLETGSYSSKYQNAIGGVIVIKSPDFISSNNINLETSLFSLSGANFIISEDFQDYLIIGGRISTLNLTYGRFPELTQGNTFPDYGNAQIKGKKRLDPNHSLYLYTFFARDVYGINLSTDIQTGDDEVNPILAGGSFDYGRMYLTTALRWEYEREKLKNQLSLIYFTKQNSTTARFVNFEIDTVEQYVSFGLRQDLEYKFSGGSVLEFGSEVQTIKSTISGITSFPEKTRSLLPDPLSVFDREFSITDLDLIREDVYATLYFQTRLVSDIGYWTPGIRYEIFTESGLDSITPRIQWDKTINPREWNIFFKAGLVSRYPYEPLGGTERRIRNFSLEPQINTNVGNPELDFEKSDSYSLGFSYPFLRLWFFQLEPFYVNYRDLILRDVRISNRFENAEIGISRGVEFILRKNSNFKSPLYGWLSYTYSENFRKIQNQDWIESDFDLRHNLNLVMGYRFNQEWAIGIRWFVRSSFPYTPIIADDGGVSRNPFTNQRIYYPIYSPYENTARLPAFHRLDLRLDRYYHYQWGFMNFYLEFLNLYGRNNFTDIAWNPARPARSELNPRLNLDPTTFRIQSVGITLPLINFGLEVQF